MYFESYRRMLQDILNGQITNKYAQIMILWKCNRAIKLTVNGKREREKIRCPAVLSVLPLRKTLAETDI